MREIKFRAWVLKDGKMIQHRNRAPAVKMFTTDYGYTNKEVIVMQYTGLKDKNGTDIYEGDIVTSASPKLIFQVVYKAPSFCRKWIDDVSKRYHDPIEPMAWNTHIICEVIGNIYEHPHLLRGDSP